MGQRILIAAPVHQSKEIFKEYLNSLNHLIIPEGYSVDKFFFLHNCPELKEYLNKDDYQEIINNNYVQKEKNQQKKWTLENFSDLSKMRTMLLQLAKAGKYDYLFTVDSDLLLHPKTLENLLEDKKDIVGNMLWTKMATEVTSICLKDEYWGRYPDESIFLTPGIYEVGYTCACLLISSKIFNNSNINYYPINGVDNTGCEDYAFCLRAKCNIPNLKIYIDTKYPARHLYHEKDYERWMKEKQLYE